MLEKGNGQEYTQEYMFNGSYLDIVIFIINTIK